MRIGPHTLAAPFCQAGLAGYSDRAMRNVARRRGCPFAVTEALLDTVMLAGGKGLEQSIDVDDEDHPVAGQVIGSEPEQVAAAAAILHARGYDVVDLNFACPVKKVKNKARGGHMLRDVPRGTAILRATRELLPNATLTVSTRRSFDDSAESAEMFEQTLDACEEFGVAAVRVHARTVEQKYAGKARWPALADVKRCRPHLTLWGSGDVFTAADALRLKLATGCDGVWVARGAIGNPWVFAQCRALWDAARQDGFDAAGLEGAWPAVAARFGIVPPSVGEQRAALEEHFAGAMQIHGESTAGRRMRKAGIKYARFHPEARAAKDAFINVRSLREWTDVLDRLYADATCAGVWPDRDDAADETGAGCEG